MAKAESNLISGLNGSIENLTYMQTAKGIVVRARTVPHDPRTPAQSLIRHHMAAAATLYKGLTAAQLLAWQAYASSLPPQVNANGKVTKLRTCDVFSKLALKFYQVTPNGTPPLLPPSAFFSGENVSLVATAAPGLITFTADAPNSPPVVTELLLQPLASVIRTPAPKGYRSQGFFEFRLGHLDFGLEVKAGVYVPAYRFVQAQTGQHTPLVPLPLLTV